jgi:dolichol-phosphate mannosyltransferase
LRIAIIIPTFNEAGNLPRLVSVLLSLPLDLELLVVDDNSQDGTGQIADGLAAANPGRVRVIHRKGKLGLSSAYLMAFESLLDSRLDAIGQMDADFSHDPGALPGMVKTLETCDVVIGSRYIKGGSTDVDWPVWRKALSGWGNFYARTILHIPLRDVTGGYRLWRRETLEAMPLKRVRSSGYVFTVELIYLAWCLKFKIAEIPIYFAERRSGKSKMSFRIQAEAAFRVWQVLWSFRDIRRKGRVSRQNITT